MNLVNPCFIRVHPWLKNPSPISRPSRDINPRHLSLFDHRKLQKRPQIGLFCAQIEKRPHGLIFGRTERKLARTERLIARTE
jgi:hypothetical protein